MYIFKVGEEGFFVEGGVLKMERVDDVVDFDFGVVKFFFGFFGGSVGISVDLDGIFSDYGVVDFVDDIVDFFYVEGVGDYFIVGKDVL